MCAVPPRPVFSLFQATGWNSISQLKNKNEKEKKKVEITLMAPKMQIPNFHS